MLLSKESNVVINMLSTRLLHYFPGIEMDIKELIFSRTSASSYDSARSLSDAEIAELVRLATHAPSAFNMQNWKFIAVRSPEAKQKLLPMAYNQAKIVESAVTFIVCGTLNPQTTLPGSLRPSVDAGVIDEGIYEMWVAAATKMYSGNPVFQRDEAIRSASLAGMTLMLAAQGKGLVSCPMIGFDAKAVAESFLSSDDEVPVLLITVGYAGDANWAQKPRKEVQDVLALI
jgi:nitroreductase